MPVAAAADRRGGILIVDQAGQRIRRIADGLVTTIAGGGSIDATGLAVGGGYHDGPAREARFNEPTGIVVASDNTIYVSDGFNHCIRKIKDGIVSTVAGSPDSPGASDGPADKAQFNFPHALALDHVGNLYVADSGNGIRKLTVDGIVSTVGKSDAGVQFLGIGVSEIGNRLSVFAANARGLTFLYRSNPESSQTFNGAEGNLSTYPYGIASLGNDEFLVTDPRRNVIRLYRLPEYPGVTQPAAPVVAGIAYEDDSRAAGDRDGMAPDARFYAPLGVAVNGSKMIVADTGNRKIRIGPLPSTRRTLANNPSEVTASQNPNDYRIVYIGASHSFWDTTWEESIEGLLEAKLNANRRSIGLTRHARISVIRLDSTSIQEQIEYLAGLEGGLAPNLVIFGVETTEIAIPPTTAGDGLNEAAGRFLSKYQTAVESAGTTIVAFIRPHVENASIVDDIFDRERSGRPSFSIDPDLSLSVALFRKTAGKAIVVSTLPDYRSYQLAAARVPLWAADDTHENRLGRTFIANLLYKNLVKLRPWLTTGKR